MGPIGEKLKNARLEQGLTLEDVHKKTKIHLNVLKSIEEGSLVDFSPVYIKGFLKIYCKFLGVEYSDNLLNTKPVQAAFRPQQDRKKPVPAVIKSDPVWAGALKFIRNNIKAIVLVVIVFIVIIGLFNLGKFVALKLHSLPKKSTVAVRLASKVVKQEKKNEPVKAQKALKPQAAVVKPETPKPEAAVFSGIRLGIRTKEDCWLQVKPDGKTIFQGILKKGRFENWQAKEKIELSLGNAGVVELEVNGKIITSLGRRGQAVKNILITKGGLSTAR